MKRLFWIDSAKALGIILVVLGHVPSAFEYRWVIYLFHMPLFFVLSGYLFKFISPRKELGRSFKSLVVPYFIYSFALYVLWIIKYRTFSMSLFLDILLANQNAMGSSATSLCPLWFIVSLFFMRMLTSVLRWDNAKLTPPLFATICIISSYFGLFMGDDYLKVGSSLLCMPFFLMGIWLRNNDVIERIVDEMHRNKIALSAFVFIIVLSLYEGRVNGQIDVISLQYGNSIVIFYVVAAILSLAFMLLCSICLNRDNKVLRLLSDGTLLVLSLHYVMISPLNALFGKYRFGFIVVTGVILLVCLLFIGISKRWFPVMIGKWK